MVFGLGPRLGLCGCSSCSCNYKQLAASRLSDIHLAHRWETVLAGPISIRIRELGPNDSTRGSWILHGGGGVTRLRDINLTGELARRNPSRCTGHPDHRCNYHKPDSHAMEYCIRDTSRESYWR